MLCICRWKGEIVNSRSLQISNLQREKKRPSLEGVSECNSFHLDIPMCPEQTFRLVSGMSR
jgi:hypothetical protein